MLSPYEFSVKTDLPLAKFIALMSASSLPKDASIRTKLLHSLYQLTKSDIDSIDCIADDDANSVNVTVYFKSAKKKLYFQSVINANPEE